MNCVKCRKVARKTFNFLCWHCYRKKQAKERIPKRHYNFLLNPFLEDGKNLFEEVAKNDSVLQEFIGIRAEKQKKYMKEWRKKRKLENGIKHEIHNRGKKDSVYDS